MSKATTAVVSLIVVACIFAFARWFSAVLAANAIVSTLFMALILMVTLAGMARRGRGRSTGRSRWLLCHAAPGLAILLAPGLAWGIVQTSFNGVAKLIPTGSVNLSVPEDIVVDSQGNIYVIDLGNDDLVEISAAGVVTTQTFSTLGGLSSPAAVAVDGSGNIYVADSGHHRVVELAAGVESVVDTGDLVSPTTGNPDGLVLDAAGDLFIADAGANDIVEIPASGSGAVVYSFTGGLSLSAPQGLAVDTEGNLWIADTGNSRIVTVTVGQVGSTLPISCSTGLDGPRGVALDGSNNVYIADTGHSRIVKVTSPSGNCAALATTQPLSSPAGVAVDYWGGSVYIANSIDANLVELLESPVNLGDLPVGSSSPTVMSLPFTVGTGVTLGSVKVLTMGTASLDFTVVATGTTCAAGATAGACNLNVQFSPTTAGLRKGTVVLFNNASPNAPILTIPLYGTGNAPLASLTPGNASVVSVGSVVTLNQPTQIALDGAGNMYVVNQDAANVLKLPPGGGSAIVVGTGAVRLQSPSGVAVDGAGNLYIADQTREQAVEVTPAGVASVYASFDDGTAPGPMAMDLAGNLYVVDFDNSDVIKVSPGGAQSPVQTGSIAVGLAASVAVDAAGTVYIADPENGQVVKVTAAGAASIVTLPGFLGQAFDDYIEQPEGVGVDGMGNLYVTDNDGYGPTIWEVTTGGQTAVEYVQSPTIILGSPQGVAVDGNGNLFIPDPAVNQIVEINSAGGSQMFQNTFVGQSTYNFTGTTVTNIGNLPLTFTGNPTYTTNFPLDSEEFDYQFLCGSDTALGAGEICDVHAYFNPQSVGALSANILVTDNSLNGANVTQTVVASGIGLAADSTAVTVSTLPTSAYAGQPITITAVVSDTTSGDPGGVPTGAVTFTDTVGVTNTPLNGGNPVTLQNGSATLTGVLLSGAGSHTITAYYSGVPNMFAASSNTTTILIAAPLVSAVTLSIAPARSVVAGTAATLTATVMANSAPVTAGTVLFCNVTAAQCSGEAVYGSAQLTSAGTAAIKLTLGVGTYSILAKFQATNPTLAGVSAPQPLTVTGAASYLSYTAIAESGVAGDYTLTGTVTAFGAVVPTGTVSFLDTRAGNGVVGTAALNPASLGFTFLPAAGSPVSTGQAPLASVLGDFNHDGKLDMAVVNVGDQTISVLLGNGDGTFQPQVTYAVGHQSEGIAMGDFNRDGNLDLVVSNYADDTVSVLLGIGDGTFAPQVTYAIAQSPQGIAVADFNHDGHLDLAVVNTFGAAVTILLGQGDGTFVADSPATFAVGNYPVAIATADFNGDGNADLVVTNSGDGSASVLLGNGDGTFQSQVVLTLPGYPDLTPVAVGDFNGDGIPDFAVGDAEYDDIYVFLGINGLTFQAPVSYTVGNAPFGIVAADFQGTGHLDLAVTNLGDSTVSLLLNQGGGTGTFQTQVTFPAGSSPTGVTAGDLNGDGLPDLAVANNSYSAPFTASILLAAQTETAVATGQAVYGTGTHNVLASYPGDADRAPSQSTTVSLAAIPLTATATTFTAEPNPAFAGQLVTLTATVTPVPTGTPLGTVSFYNGSTLLGMATVNSSGVATFVGSLPAGVLSVTAVYSGNAEFAGSTSSAQTVTVNLNPTTTTLTAAPNPANQGQVVTLTATVNPPPAFDLGLRGHAVPGPISLGTVSFYYGETLLGSGNVNFSGVATSSTATLPVGADGVTAVYSGDSGFAGSTSSVYTETITAVAATSTTTVMTASPNPANLGQSVALTATVNPVPIAPDLRGRAVAENTASLGTVSFYYGETLLGTGNVNSSGVATSSTTTLPVGADGLTAVYSGDTGFSGSTSIVYTETITGAVTSTTTVLTALPNPAVAGQSVTLTATVAPAPTGTPAGTVSFYNGTTLLGTTAVNSSGIAAFVTSSLPAGTLSITAVYSGNAGFAASTSTAVTETVAAPPASATTTTLTVSPNPSFDGQPVTLTATVTPAPTGTPAGIVTFYSGTTVLGTCTLNASGVATLTLSSLAVGADSITAAYPGNAGFAASTSPAVSETVTTAYTVTGPATPVPVAPGGSVNINITVPPLGGAFDSVVTLSASGLPPGATATFNPPTVTPGSAGAPTVMTIQLATLAASNSDGHIPAHHNGFPLVPFTLGFAVFGAVLGRKRIPRTLVLGLALAVLGVSTLAVTGCGGGFANTPSTPPGNYTVTVTGTSGAFQASTTMTLVVE